MLRLKLFLMRLQWLLFYSLSLFWIIDIIWLIFIFSGLFVIIFLSFPLSFVWFNSCLAKTNWAPFILLTASLSFFLGFILSMVVMSLL